MEKAAGHAFISYVREDAHHVDRLQRILEAAGVSVWRDTADLWPGEDWRMKIRHAITDNALVFIACFSSQSAARAKSYQNEELVLAADQLRLRRPDDPWLIPVRFDDCPVPDLDLGGGRTLASIQHADLFGEHRDAGTTRLLITVQRLLGQRPSGQDTRPNMPSGTPARHDPTQERPAATTDLVDHVLQQAPFGQQAPSANPPPHRAIPLVTDRWRLTTDGHQVPILMQIRNNSMSHPGYASRSPTENPPPSMRIGVVVPCEPLGSTPATSDIRASFLNFLYRQPVSDVLAALTTVDPEDNWTARDGHGRVNFGAVLGDDTETAPVAWARLLLAQADTPLFGYDPRSAVFILHVYPRTHEGSPAPPANLANWHDRFAQGLAIPGALAAFLTQDLGLETADDQPVQAGVYLDAPHSMTELVDTADLKSLPGSPASNWFMGWAISSPHGQQAPALAREWLAQMCDNTLYVDAYEPYLEALITPRQAPADTAFKASQVPSVHGTSLITTKIAVRRLKQALPDPTRRVEVSDLIDREIQQLASRIGDTTRHPLGGMPFADQRASYEEESAISACLLATGVFHGDEIHTSLWIRSLRRLISARRPITGSYNAQTEAMRHYPALLCLWAMGISAILADRENLLAHFLLEPTWTPIFGEPEPQPAVRCLNPNRIVIADDATPEGGRWLYPQSHHIRTTSRDTFSQIEPDDDTYWEACDRLEYLASLIALDTDAPNGSPWAGEFMTRDRYHNQDPKLRNLLEGGAFGSDPERAQAAREALTTWINQHPRF
jgi:hypothetical protein